MLTELTKLENLQDVSAKLQQISTYLINKPTLRLALNTSTDENNPIIKDSLNRLIDLLPEKSKDTGVINVCCFER